MQIPLTYGWLDFKVTNRCNNKCTYCGVQQDSPDCDEKIPIERIIDTNRLAIDIGFKFFAFLGGEPSIRKDAPMIFDPFTISSNHCNLLVITNMKYFNEDIYRSLFGTKSYSAYLVASIDRLMTPNYKGQNSKHILSNLRKIQEISCSYNNLGERGVQVHCVVSRENWKEFPTLVEFFWSREINVSLAMVEPLVMVMTSPSHYNEFTRDEIYRIIENLDKLEGNNKLSFPNQVLREYLECYLNNTLHLDQCNAGLEHVIIESDGNVYPCLTESYRRGLSFGNIIREDFKLIYERMDKFSCRNPLADTCWDHYLWNRLGDHIRGGV